MDGFGGFAFKAETAAATPARAAKKGGSSGDGTTQILGDRSSRENAKPANSSNSGGGNGNAPSTPMAAGPLRGGAARAKIGRATCPSSQKAYIQVCLFIEVISSCYMQRCTPVRIGWPLFVSALQ